MQRCKIRRTGVGHAIFETTDAKNWYVEASYDSLGRIKVRNYSETNTPDVSFYYDGKGLASVPDHSKGKTTKVTSSSSETPYMTFDLFGRVLTHRQTTEGTNYDTDNTYNVAGALVEETYPSTRKLNSHLTKTEICLKYRARRTLPLGFYRMQMHSHTTRTAR